MSFSEFKIETFLLVTEMYYILIWMWTIGMIFQPEPSCKVENNSFELILDMIFFQWMNFPFSTLHIHIHFFGPTSRQSDSYLQSDVVYNLIFIEEWMWIHNWQVS